MHVIWKFKLSYADIHDIPMPENAEFLHFAMQDAYPTIWVLVAPNRPTESRRFALIETDHTVPEGAHYLGTTFDPPFVWHLFEMNEK